MEKVEAVKECGVDLSETTARELGELVGAENISRFREFSIPMMFPISGCLDHANLAVSWRCLGKR